jgi:tetratricopeptide (TPR) repeat protein
MAFEEMSMSGGAVTEKDVEIVENLGGSGEYSKALALAQELLFCPLDDETKMKILFNVISCSTRLELDDVTEAAFKELEKLPDPEMSRAVANTFRAISYIYLGRPHEALNVINLTLGTECVAEEYPARCKYQLLAYQGRALTMLSRWEEALISLTEAHRIDPEGMRETDILIDTSRCMQGLKQYEDSYNSAHHVLERESGDMAIMAMHYMAVCRTYQGRLLDALNLYGEIQKRLPCTLIDTDQIRKEMLSCMDAIGISLPSHKPS